MAAILHDLGWDQTPNSTTVSVDRRFEVDGAIAARDFILSHVHGQNAWDNHRVQLVWDSIALHTQASIYKYKEETVAVTGSGILMDFQGPSDGVTQQEFDSVLAAFPKMQFEEGINQTFVWLCMTKPETTYGESRLAPFHLSLHRPIGCNVNIQPDTFMQPWGDNYVANYSANGYRIFDVLSALPL